MLRVANESGSWSRTLTRDCPFRRRKADRYTRVFIFSGLYSAAWVVVRPPKLWPTRITGSDCASKTLHTFWVQASKVTCAVGVLSLPEPGRSTATTLCPFCFRSRTILSQHQAPCQAPWIKIYVANIFYGPSPCIMKSYPSAHYMFAGARGLFVCLFFLFVWEETLPQPPPSTTAVL